MFDRGQGQGADGFWGFLGRWFWLLAAGLVVGAVIAVGYAGGQRLLVGGKTYESRTVLQVQYRVGPTGDVVRSGSDLDNARLIVAERGGSPSYLRRVASRLSDEMGIDANDLSEMSEVIPAASNDPRGSVTIAVSHKEPKIAETVARTMADVMVEVIETEVEARLDVVLVDTAAAVETIRNDLSAAVTARQETLVEVSANPTVAPLISVNEGGDLIVTSPAETEADTDELIALEQLLTPYSLANARVSATLGAYSRQNADLYEATVNKAKLDKPLIVLQEASLAKPKGHDLRLRDFFVLGAGGGLVLAWVAANFVDNFMSRRRGDDHAQGWGASPPPPEPSPPSTGATAPALQPTLDIRNEVERQVNQRLLTIRRETAEAVRVEVVRALNDRLPTDLGNGEMIRALERRVNDAVNSAAERASRQVMKELDERVRKLGTEAAPRGRDDSRSIMEEIRHLRPKASGK